MLMFYLVNDESFNQRLQTYFPLIKNLYLINFVLICKNVFQIFFYKICTKLTKIFILNGGLSFGRPGDTFYNIYISI